VARILAKTTCRVKESISTPVVTSHRMPLPQNGRRLPTWGSGQPSAPFVAVWANELEVFTGESRAVIRVTLPQKRHEAGGDSDTSVSAAPGLVPEPFVKVTGN
jgi:hypothetical protein